MTWAEWLGAAASAIAILAVIVGASSYLISKRKAYLERKKMERMIRFAEAAAKRDIEEGRIGVAGNHKNSN
jgi:hypothetical protein